MLTLFNLIHKNWEEELVTQQVKHKADWINPKMQVKWFFSLWQADKSMFCKVKCVQRWTQ